MSSGLKALRLYRTLQCSLPLAVAHEAVALYKIANAVLDAWRLQSSLRWAMRWLAAAISPGYFWFHWLGMCIGGTERDCCKRGSHQRPPSAHSREMVPGAVGHNDPGDHAAFL